MSHEIAINALRFLAVDAIEAAKSGHPGMPMGAAPMAYVLWTKHLKYDPAAPNWADRDRFVLSAGHGSMLMYGLLHLSGYDLSLDELKNFRQWGSKTPGHPEYGHTPGVETTTGPLGQGLSAAVGMALAERHLAAQFNKPGFDVVDHYTYSITGDGCLMEGVASEAASLAGHLGLGRLIVMWDDNRITIEGSTDITFTEDVPKRFDAYGWQVIVVEDGNDLEAIDEALNDAKAVTDKPSLIRVRTHIGFGSPNKQGTSGVHGAPLGHDEVLATKANLCWPAEPAFHAPEEAYAPFRTRMGENACTREGWNNSFAEYAKAHPELADQWSRRAEGKLPDGWAATLPVYETDAKGIASRAASGNAINAVAEVLPELIGGSADLAPSNNTYIKADRDLTPDDYGARNIRFGVREHAMGAVANGMANHGMVRPYDATFFVFADYMRPAIRMAALMSIPVVHVMTHDSFYLGEDGPTHQPVEHLASLRAMPNVCILRPADANETSQAWKIALERTTGPTLLVLSRQNLPTLDRSTYAPADGVAKGGYILKEAQSGAANCKAILIGSGSEVHLAIDAAAQLEARGIPTRVVNLASWDLFDAQPQSYRDEVLPPALTLRVSVEAGHSMGWERYVGCAGGMISIDHFGGSAPANVLSEQFGFTADKVVQAVTDRM